MGRYGDYENSVFKQLQEVMGRLDSVEKDLRTEKREHKEDVKRLEKMIEKKNEEIKVLKKDNERMRRIINNDSSNSSLPPSSDRKGKPANTYNSRKKSDRKVGGQIGHKGTTLTKADVEKKIQEGKLAHTITSHGCGTGKYVSKYVIDLQVTATAHEHRFYADEKGEINIPEKYKSDVSYGSFIKAMSVELYSVGVMANDRICEFINTISGNALDISKGSVYGFCKKFAQKAEPSVTQIKEELLNAKTISTDATVMTVNGKTAYIRNQSTSEAVLYSAMESKNIDTLKTTGVLSDYTGTLVHDHETALYRFGTAHGECNVHLLRYLKKNTEETGNQWSSELSELLCAMNTQRKKYIAENTVFTAAQIADYYQKYSELIEKGRVQNKQTKGEVAKREERTLLNRLDSYKDNHLLFLKDFSVPFENNMSERDLRKCKNRQKMSGGFRKQTGNEMYCTIMSVIETCKRKEMQVFDNIRKIFEGTPAIF